VRIGVISDTHGYLDGFVFHAFADVQQILHAGDVGEDRILDELEEIAPVIAVSGNVDFGVTPRRPHKWCGDLAGVRICMTHGHLLDARDYNKSALEFFAGENPQIIIHGHSHIARHDKYEGISFLNPGAACRPRFRDVPSVAIIEVRPDKSFEVTFTEIPRR
jgi:putative phosphoesterase